MLDVFNSDAFSFRTLTDAILKAPYRPGRIEQLGLFRSSGITTVTVMVEEKNGQLSLIQSSQRGGTGSSLGMPKRTGRAFAAIHLERNATILADEVQGVRSFGSENSADAVQQIVNERLAELRSAHEVTLEHLRIGAVKGQVLDADGSTITDLFTEFNVQQQSGTVDPDSSADNGDALRGQVVALQRLIEAELGAEPVSTYRAFCGADFFDTFRADLGVVQTLRYADPASLLAQGANARSFNYAGVAWEEYRGSTGGTPFVPDAEAYLFPEGTNIFKTYFAPADFKETVNTVGFPMYAKLAEDPELQRYTKVHTQSNPLNLCTRPRCVVKVTLAT